MTQIHQPPIRRFGQKQIHQPFPAAGEPDRLHLSKMATVRWLLMIMLFLFKEGRQSTTTHQFLLLMLMMQGRLLSLRILDYVALHDNYFETAIAELVQLDFIFIPNSMTMAIGGAPCP